MKLDRGICPGCGHDRPVRKDGVMLRHPGPIDKSGTVGVCSGSGIRPASVAPDPTVAAELRGYRRAIADLRAAAPINYDDDAGGESVLDLAHATRGTHGVDWDALTIAADWLESRLANV